MNERLGQVADCTLAITLWIENASAFPRLPRSGRCSFASVSLKVAVRPGLLNSAPVS
jgi:hypothetical protein